MAYKAQLYKILFYTLRNIYSFLSSILKLSDGDTSHFRLQIYEKSQYFQTKHPKNSIDAAKNDKRPGKEPVFSEAFWSFMSGTRPLLSSQHTYSAVSPQ